MKKILSFILASVMLMFGLTSCAFGSNTSDSASSSEKSSIEFVQSELEMEIGESVQAEITVSKKNVFIYWNVRDKEIASVSSKGVITALAPGETVVYAEFSGETAMCLVKVKEKSAIPELSVSVPYYDNQVSVYSDGTLALNPVVRFGDAIVTDATVEYTVADAQIATVDNGSVIGAAVGTTTVTITATYQSQTATAVVNVQVITAGKAIKALTVAGQRTTFTIGDKFVFGGVVNVEYLDGMAEENVDYYTIDLSGFNASKAGTQTITVKVGDVTTSYTVTVVKASTLKLLMIGNSFSQDTVMWMPEIAQSLGFTEYVIGTLVIGGCTLNTHYLNSQSNAADYEFVYYSSKNPGWKTESKVTMQYGLQFTDWGFVSLQQQSGNSGNVSTYNSDLEGLVSYVKATALTRSNVKLVWNMTWAYPTDSTWFNGLYGNDQMTMYNSILSAVQSKIVTNDNFCLISPAGTSIQNGRTSSYLEKNYVGADDGTLNAWNRDGAHLSVYEGRFTSAMTMFCTVTGYMPNEITYNPTNVDEIEARIIRESVTNALTNPFAVTNSQYTA